MAREYPEFISFSGNITEEGKKVIAFIKETVKGTNNNAKSLNSLSPVYRRFFANVQGFGDITEEQFVEDHRHSGIRRVWEDMTLLQESDEQKKDVKDTKDKQTELEESLMELQKEFKAQKKLLTTSKAELTKLNKKLNKKILEDETDVEDDEDDDETEDKKDDDDTADESTDDTNKDDDKSEDDG